MRNKQIAVFLIVAVALLLVACGSPTVKPTSLEEVGRRVETSGGVYTDITVNELKGLQQGDDDFLLVNTHIPFEGDLPGTDVSIPYDEIAQHLDQHGRIEKQNGSAHPVGISSPLGANPGRRVLIPLVPRVVHCPD